MSYPAPTGTSLTRTYLVAKLRGLCILRDLLFVAALVYAPKFAHAASPICGENSGSFSCSYTCDNESDDVTNINAAIAQVSGAGGGVVSVSAGTCQVNSPVAFQSPMSTFPNVWLKGAGSGTIGSGTGGTVFQRTIFQLNQPMIVANKPPAGGYAQTNANIQITDLSLDPGKLVITTLSPVSVSAGSASIQLPASKFTQQIGSSFSGIGPGIYDFSSVGNVVLPANGNVTSVSGNSKGITLGLTAGALPGAITQGDILAFYSGGGGIDEEYVTGLQINNVQLLHGSQITIENDENFVISNNRFYTDNNFSTFFCLGGAFIGANGLGSNDPQPNNYGLIANNVLSLTNLEVDSFNTVVSGNTVRPTSCGGINGGTGEYDTFEGNVISASLLTTTDQAYPSVSVPFNHDNLFDPSMQITNSNALIADNLAYEGGGDGVYSSGLNNVLARNTAYNNSRLPGYNNPRGGSGIALQGGGSTVLNQYVVSNLSCNTSSGSSPNAPSGPPNCLTSANSGSQQYALDIRSGVNDTNVGYDNQFFPGAKGVVGNLPGSSINYSSTLPEATISVTSCSLNVETGTCNVTISWSSTNAGSVSVYEASSDDLSQSQVVGTGETGSIQIAIGNAIYTFRVMSNQGLQIASATVQPVNYAK